MKDKSKGLIDPDYVILDNPFTNMTNEQKNDFFKMLTEEGAKEYEKNLEELTEFAKNFDILSVLCFFSMYCLTTTAGAIHSIKDDNSIAQFHVELLQALMLQSENKGSKPFLSEDAQKIAILLKKIPENLFNKRLGNIKTVDDLEKNLIVNIEMFMAQNMTVRNWGYKEQVLRLTKELFEPIDDLIKEKIGLSLTSLLTMLESLLENIEGNMNSRRKIMGDIYNSSNMNEMIDLFIDYYPFFQKEKLTKISAQYKSKEEFAKYLIFILGDQIIYEIYSFSLEDCVRLYPESVEKELINRVLQNWSYNIGELKDFPTDYIFYGNPVWEKPLIRLNENNYCWPIPGLFLSFIIELLETVFIEDERLKKIYERRRGKFLEDKIEDLFKKGFINSEIYKNLERIDEDGENDVLILIDSYAIIIEAKSGKISSSARRGSPERLKKEIDKLIIHPSKQAKDFAKYIKNNLLITEFTNKKKEKILIDLSNIKHVFTFSITLDLFGALASRTPVLFEAGLVDKNTEVDVSPSMSLADLETFFELLETDSEKIHYLIRRSQFDKNASYLADELDLLAFYLQTGFNIGETEFEKIYMHLYGLSQEILDTYLVNKELDTPVQVSKPLPRRTDWWQNIIERLEERKTPGWSQMAYTLLNTSFEDQVKFEKKVNEVKKIVDGEWMNSEHINSVILENGPKKRKELVIGYCYKNISNEKRNQIMKNNFIETIENADLDRALIIGLDVNKIKEHYPYSVIAVIGNIS